MTGDTDGAARGVATNAGEIFIKRQVISFNVLAAITAITLPFRFIPAIAFRRSQASCDVHSRTQPREVGPFA